MLHVETFFEQPGLWFNLLSFAFTTLGALLGVWALWIAFVQLRKTLTAARAAEAAAERAVTEVRAIATVVEVERLSGLCREIITLLRSDRRLDAVRPMHDLRIGLAKARSTRNGGELFVPGAEWNATIAEIAEIQRRLGRAGDAKVANRMAREFSDRIADVDQRLNELSPRAAEGASTRGE